MERRKATNWERRRHCQPVKTIGQLFFGSGSHRRPRETFSIWPGNELRPGPEQNGWLKIRGLFSAALLPWEEFPFAPGIFGASYGHGTTP
jgi:hypothetical protein